MDDNIYHINITTYQEYQRFREWLLNRNFAEKASIYLNGITVEFADQLQRLMFIAGMQEGFRISREEGFFEDVT